MTDDAITEAIAWNSAAQERSERWPLDRFIRHVNALGQCPEDLSEDACARSVQSKFSGGAGGNARITYSPSVVRHLLQNYAALEACEERLKTLGLDEQTMVSAHDANRLQRRSFSDIELPNHPASVSPVPAGAVLASGRV